MPGSVMTPLALQAVVHDLKNALGTLESELERLVVQQHLGAVSPAYLQCSRLRLRLLGFLLMSSDDGQMKAQIEAHALDDFLHEVHAGFVMAAGGPTLDIALAAEGPPLAFFDARLLNLALHALLANAAQFARTRIVLGAAKAAAGVMFYCEDDGPGWGCGATPGGSGLGTAICEGVVRAHNSGLRQGQMVLATSALGGARVELHLP